MDRRPQRVGRFDYLPRDIEHSTSEVLEKELDLMRKLTILKTELEIRYDYTIHAAFRSVDRYNEGYIDSYNLGTFLKNNGHYASERELMAIIRRIDTDGDARISYAEFTEFMCGDSSASQRIADLERSIRARSEVKARRNMSAYSSPIR